MKDDNVQLILRSHFKDEDLTVVSVERPDTDTQRKGNDQFNSNIEKWRIKYKRNKGDSDINAETLDVVMKFPLMKSYMHKIMSRIIKAFMREVFWYVEALPILKDRFPILESSRVSPICYHGVTEYGEDFR